MALRSLGTRNGSFHAWVGGAPRLYIRGCRGGTVFEPPLSFVVSVGSYRERSGGDGGGGSESPLGGMRRRPANEAGMWIPVLALRCTIPFSGLGRGWWIPGGSPPSVRVVVLRRKGNESGRSTSQDRIRQRGSAITAGVSGAGAFSVAQFPALVVHSLSHEWSNPTFANNGENRPLVVSTA